MKVRRKFSDKSLRRYYDRTSEVDSGKKAETVRMGFAKPRRLVALRLEEETIGALQRLAARKGLNFSTLMRMWITERLAEELPGSS